MFGSSWANPQQNQQGGSAFGQPSGFGGSAFGSGGAFGQNPQQQQQQPQPQQPQQPQANPMFGNFSGGTNTNPSGTGFGTSASAFGSTPATGSTALFGGPKPATGFGAFGGGGSGATFGSTSAFGQNSNTGPSAFGQPNTSTSAFGSSGGGLFGSNKPATGFGQSNPNAGPYDGVPPVTTGSVNPPYSVFSEKDQTNPSVTLQYQSITCMPPYRGTSFEELRLQDYQQGRKTATASSAFGATAFGSSAQPSTGGLFGQNQSNQPTTSAFGSFGTPATNTSGGFGSFGQPSNTAGSTGGFGAFGGQQQQQQQQQQQPQTSAFGGGAFGATQQQQPQPSSGGLFNSANTSTFGKPSGTFGAPASGFGATSAFGQSQQQPQQNPSVFGNQPQQNTGFGGNAFGSNSNTGTKSLFGQPQPASGFGTSGLFGAAQNTTGQQSQQPSTGVFGNTNTGGLFGQNAQQQSSQPNQFPGLFGNTLSQAQPSSGLFSNQTSGLFGNAGTQQQQQQSAPGNNFFGKPSTGTSVFGSSTNTTAPTQTNPLFGNSTLGQPSNQQSTSAFGTLFGGSGKSTAPTQPAGHQAQNPFAGSSFGGSLGGSSAFAGSVPTQGTLTPSIDQPVGTNLAIFSMLSPGPHAVTLDGSKKKMDLFVDVPTRSPIPFAPRGSVPANSKLRGGPRGFASSSHLSPSINGLGSSLSFSSGKANVLNLTKQPSGGNTSSPEFFSSPSLGSGGRESVKKLVFDKKVALSELSGRATSPNNVIFNPALSIAAREEAANGPLTPGALRTTASSVPQPSPTPNRSTAQSIVESLSDKTAKEPKEGEYWSNPDMSILAKWGPAELVFIRNLVVGRVGYGTITFLEPVDFTDSGNVDQLFNNLIRFEDKECSVYPDLPNVEKPAPGSGLNVRARVELVGCWAADKSTREPIKDENHPQAIKHVKRLKNMKDTHFDGFDIKEGKWTFTVDHF